MWWLSLTIFKINETIETVIYYGLRLKILKSIRSSIFHEWIITKVIVKGSLVATIRWNFKYIQYIYGWKYFIDKFGTGKI